MCTQQMQGHQGCIGVHYLSIKGVCECGLYVTLYGIVCVGMGGVVGMGMCGGGGGHLSM